MQSFNTQFRDKNSLEDFITSNSIKKYKNILVQVFSGIVDEKQSLDLSSHIQEILPTAKIIGTTTSGEICAGKIFDKTVTVSFTTFDTTVVKSGFYTLDENFKLEDISKDLIMSDTKAIIIFSDGLKSNAERLLKDLYALRPDIVIAGGRAGDNILFEKTYVFDEIQHSENACVIASLSGDELLVNSDYILNWTPIGKDMVVTKAKDNILYELDGMPIFEVYEKYLGSSVIEDFPQSSLEFPLIIKKDHIYVARDSLLRTEDNAIMYAGNFEIGDTVRFSFGNIEDITDETYEYFDKFKKLPAESVFIYSCTARKSLMGDKLEDEMNILESLAPTVGFFTYGEFFHTSNIMELLNVTTTFLALSESPAVKNRTLKIAPPKEYDSVKKVLTHLIKVATEELEHISTHDSLTAIYNRAEYIKRVCLKIKGAQRYNEHFGLILLDIDYFKLVNDNYGHVVGDKVLQQLATTLLSNVREDDLVARWGGEEFIIIVNYATVEILEKLTKKLQKKIAEVDFHPIHKLTVSFGLSVYIDGDTEETLFKRVDNALYAAKNSGRDCYIIG